MLGEIKAYAAQAIALVLLALLLVQTGRLHTEQLAHQRLITSAGQADTQRATASLKIEQQAGAAESTHAKQTQKASDAYTTSQPVRDALHRVDIARADRLRTDADRRAATYSAMSQSCAAASSGIADRLAALDAHIVRGAGVVAGLGADLARRDAEVALQRAVIDADRALTAPGEGP